MKEKQDTIVIIPALNEERSIRQSVTDVRETTGLPVVVVNDCSEDRTKEAAREAGAIVLDLACNLGSWGAMQAGIRYAVQQGYDKAVTFDADGQHLAEWIQPLLAGLELYDADVVIGSYVPRASPLRKGAWKLFRILAKLHYEDLTSGFRAYNRAAMRLLASPKASLIDYQDVGVLMLLREYGMSMAEIGVDMRLRKDGKSRIFSSWFKVAEYMCQSCLLSLIKPKCPRCHHK